jgi:hypothetical protein
MLHSPTLLLKYIPLGLALPLNKEGRKKKHPTDLNPLFTPMKKPR